jgi:hypothetical protein
MTRRQLFSSACALTALTVARSSATTRHKTKYLVLVTADGLRWQEIFTGIDPQLMNDKNAGMANENAAALRNQLWRPTAEERRTALMPFFWGKLAPQGIVLGNRNKGSSVEVTNRFRSSSPGYSELLTGRAQDDIIRSNGPVQNPTPSFFEFLKNRWRLPREQAAIFASWSMLHYVGETRRGEIFINAGYEDSSLPDGVPRVAELNRLQHRALYIEDSARHDAFTLELGLEYLKAIQPRLFYLAFDETDDWAHDKRYDRVLESIQFFDAALAQLWDWLQASPHYRDATAFIVTCDHGRGATPADWDSHGSDVAGAEQIWVAIAGPDTPARGEVANGPAYLQRDIAPTALELLGVDYREYRGVQGRPIREAIA